MEVNTIHHGDCIDVMKNIPDKFVDMVLTSPPYDGLRQYKGYSFDFEGIANELNRIVKDNGVIVWIVADQTTKDGESGNSFRQALYFQSLGFNIHDTMIYKKNAIPYPDTKRYYSCFEYMFVLSKGGEPKTFNPIQDRKNKHANMKVSGTERKADGSLKEKPCKKRGAKIKEFGFRWNVWDYNVGVANYGDKSIAQHPATFPMQLAKDHILTWSNVGDVILDPMAGSGTTLLMAKKTGRSYIGIEIAEEYVDLIKYRLDNSLYNENGIIHKRKVLW